MQKKIIGFLFPLIFLSTACNNWKFDKNQWQVKDGHYAYREKMVKDLMNNHLKKGMAYEEVVDLLGNENFSVNKSHTIVYEIMVDYGWNIDPRKGKDLYIVLTPDSIVKDFRLEKWKK